MSAPKAILDFIDANSGPFVDPRLKSAVAIHSVSGDPLLRDKVIEMAEHLKKELEAVGVTVELRDLGKQEGTDLQLPPAVLGSIGDSKNKKTLLVYGHYDVQPASKSDGWKTEDPFVLTLDPKTGQLIGRGSTDDKGPISCWINVLQAHHALDLKLPVNIKFCFEGMEESGSVGLDKFIKDNVGTGKFFDGIDCGCISDNYWLTTTKPCVTYGLRGIYYYKVNIRGASQDLHSGEFGGAIYEPMTDLFRLFSKLVAPDGTILIPGVNELVAPLTPDEEQIYQALTYDVNELEARLGRDVLVSTEKEKILKSIMRYPSLSIHGIEGASSGPEPKTVIPADITGKFSLRLVPNQKTNEIDKLVRDYLTKEFNESGSKNILTITSPGSGEPWVANYKHYNYVAAVKATEIIYNPQKADLTREGGSIPVVLTFADALKKEEEDFNICLLPIGRADDGAHSVNEKLDLSNYIEGTKVLGTYLYELAAAQ